MSARRFVRPFAVGGALGLAVVALCFGLGARPAGAESAYPLCAEATPFSGVHQCHFTPGATVSVSLTTTSGVLNGRVAYVRHPTLGLAELCAVVARSGGISVRNCPGETAHTLESAWPAVSMGSPGSYTWTFSGLPAGSWVEFVQNSSAQVEFTSITSTPWPEPTTTTTASTTTTVADTTSTTAPSTTTTVPVEPEPVDPDEISPVGSREALQWLAFLISFAVGHVVTR